VTQFPEGRCPHLDLYTPEVIDRLAEVVGVHDDRVLDVLGADLCDAAGLYIVRNCEVTTEETFTERARWIETEILAPIRTLREAIGNSENRKRITREPRVFEVEEIDRKFTTQAWAEGNKRIETGPRRWRLEATGPEAEKPISYRDLLIRELDRTEAWAHKRASWLRAQAKNGSKPETLFRDEFVQRLARIYGRLFPELPRIAKDYSKDVETTFVRFIRTAAEPVLGCYENLTAQIKASRRIADEYAELRRKSLSQKSAKDFLDD
jgi:hypothetical protein